MRSLIAALLLAFAPTCAAVAQVPHIRVDGRTLYFTGSIEYGDGAVFDGAVKLNHVDTVVLSSGGGLVDEGLRMAKLIHERGLTTAIVGEDYCASACGLMFLAGKQRIMGERANLGLHSAVDATGVSAKGTADMDDFLYGIAAAPLDIVFQIDATLPNEMWWLPADRRAEMGITTIN